MKLATLLVRSLKHVAVLEGDEYILLDQQAGDLSELAGLSVTELEKLKAASIERVSATDAQFLAPIQRFRRDVLCTGWNYWDHFEEGIGRREGQEVERPTAPTFFTKAPNSLTGPYDDIPLDLSLSEKWDYEGEMAIVIGREGCSIKAEKAMEHVFGYMLANDVSQRDLQRRHGGQWLKGKSLDRCSPIGPYIATADEIDLSEVRIETRVNGALRQSASTRQMAFSLEELIAELSFGMTLFPGDVILTGTPSGIGMARNPPEFLQPGDEIVITATGLGELRNRCRNMAN
ncbi:5-carboxymethyl-2-hydroxymuconate isomerase [Devosia limi DSM 17137]|uniref:2-keto-4-pentenoate hydratase/2-oxohepta-3-ene-1,7-dioic acid hydratase (Catechol pathway) n=1 Tax=Devosia limi DSM 17137 TaxID=1121477 RepID=A0A0F5LPX2_9HYPH|nr:fumarylacetoacetate hydrolase family protein [Devosia limi]KKB84405.1 5-carboxymethyl-2-hydroxymuconate isomerase [Devosia limi DSM 17137]SHF61201.1 2-keto-4-pentenoate hydratase/2-oxohepta-3-ene-1,7-dioic acid hydratase (catechol pathway) [Devosia limi DSM 17137]